MTRLARPAAVLGAAALLALTLTACGDSDQSAGSDSASASSAGGSGSDAAGAPDDVAKGDFCSAWNAVFEVLSSTAADEAAFGKFQDAVAHLGDVGTPAGITADQRKGFEVFVASIAGATYDEVTKSSSDNLPGVTADEEKQAEAFVQWAATEECPAVPSGAPTAVPPASPSSS